METAGYCAKTRVSCSIVNIEELGEKVLPRLQEHRS